MDAISEEQLTQIERRIVARMAATFNVDLSGLVVDRHHHPGGWVTTGAAI